MISPAQNNLIQAMLQGQQTRQEISTAVAAKTLQTARAQGAQVVNLIASAGQVQAGDPLVAKATGLGGHLDVIA